MGHFLRLIVMAVVSLTSYGHEMYPDIGVQAQSLGTAYRAVASHEDIIFYNPAGLIKHRRTGSDFFYQWSPDAQFHQLGVAVGDAQTTAWGLGLGYVALMDNKTDRAAGHLVNMALAMPIVTDMFAFGLSFSYLYDQAVSADIHNHFFNMDMGFMVNAPLGLSFAVVADHVLAAKGREKPLGLSVATAFDLGSVIEIVPLTVSFDWLMDDMKSSASLGHVVAAGMEYSALSMLPLRVGFKSSIKTGDNFLSLGAGLASSTISLDGVYQQHLTIGKIRHFGVALSLRI